MSKKSNVLRPVDYITYWGNKGPYGVERVKRMIERKAKRWKKRLESMKINHKEMQECEMGGYCESPCNGDC